MTPKKHGGLRPCRIDVFDDKAVIHLNGKRGGTALISTEDVHLAEGCSWVQNHRGYVCRRIPRPGEGVAFLHRIIMGAKSGQIVDHINRCTTDNRRSNLRFADKYTNSLNTHKRGPDVGVRRRPYNRWEATICVKKKHIYLGTFLTKEEALAARQAAELNYWKELRPRSESDMVVFKMTENQQ